MTNTTTTPKFKISGTAIFIVVLLILIVILYINSCNNTKSLKLANTNFINALYDSIHTINKQNGESIARISVLQNNSVSNFTNLKIKDSQIVELQRLADLYKNKLKAGSSVTTVNTETIVTKTVVDTMYFPDPNSIYPVYDGKHTDKWLDYHIVASSDSIDLKLKITNKYAVVLGYDKKVPFVDVINYNPYSSISTLRTYQVSVPKQKNWGIGFSAGAGFSTDFKIRPYIGIGINYNVIKF